MFTETWLLLDAHYLCYRAFHVMKYLSHKEIFTGVIYGFLRDVAKLQDDHSTSRIAFCFDHGPNKRRELMPTYKGNRIDIEYSKAEMKIRLELQRQIALLKNCYLEELGYMNVFKQWGYEGDDIIASVCQNLKKHQRAIVVSADGDLNQLLSKKVSIWHPLNKRLITINTFREEHGIEPWQWVDVKAIAGCNSDNVKGIKGVGEKTAAKYLSGKLHPDSTGFAKIVEGDEIWKMNEPIVRLPFPGTKTFKLRTDEVSARKWRGLMRRLGIKSLINQAPISTQERKRNAAKDLAERMKQRTSKNGKGSKLRTRNLQDAKPMVDRRRGR